MKTCREKAKSHSGVRCHFTKKANSYICFVDKTETSQNFAVKSAKFCGKVLLFCKKSNCKFCGMQILLTKQNEKRRGVFCCKITNTDFCAIFLSSTSHKNCLRHSCNKPFVFVLCFRGVDLSRPACVSSHTVNFIPDVPARPVSNRIRGFSF